MNKLVIVESPTKIKSLGKYLGEDFVIMSSMGHVRDLPKSKLGIEIEEKGRGEFDFVPVYELMEGKGEQVKKLEEAASRVGEVILASDPDREGEAIAWHVEHILKNSKPCLPAGRTQKLKNSKEKKLVFKRIAFHSITKEAILEALERPRDIDMDLVDAQQARRFLDRLVGYKLSPILWKKVRRGLSAGRVQSVAVRLIVEREREIEKFEPVEYWQIRALVKTQKIENSKNQNNEFWVELARYKDSAKGGSGTKKAEIHDGVTAQRILDDLEKAQYTVTDIKKSERRASPHPPFKTSTLQQAAANVLGWSAKKTMNVAQRLYEQGDITYHRTDSFNLAPIAIETVRKHVEETYGVEYLPNSPRFFKTAGKVVAQEAHEAVRPTHIEISPNVFTGQEMVQDQEKLYSLIWRRTVACQMAEAVFDDTKVVVGANEFELTATGEVIKFAGWKKLYVKDKDEAPVLPVLAVGEKLTKKKVTGDQKFTQPPARFNDASLIKELEKRGIGRPSTYASIISTIIDRRYVDQKEKKFFPTTIGIAVVDFLVANFPTEMEYEFTAKMESELDDIALGKLKWKKMLSEFWGAFKDKISKVEKNGARVGVPAMGTGKQCPVCHKGEEVIRDGKFGKFLSCSLYPECKYTAPFIEYVEGIKCEKCGKRIVLKKTRTGRDFYGCENYPSCTWASWHKPGTKKPADLAGRPPDLAGRPPDLAGK